MSTGKGGIVFFDSGIGGLTVVNECRKYLPYSTFYYYGDNKHAPYGNLPSKKIQSYVFRAFHQFEELGVEAAVIACNTATAVCVEDLRARFSFPIIGAEPAVLPAMCKGGEVFVLTTRATHESMRFQDLCDRAKRLYPLATLKMIPCDRLAGAIESHILERGFDYTPLLPEGKPSAVVLGCTHYIYIAEQIREYYQCPLYDGNEGIARHLCVSLKRKEVHDEHLKPLITPFRPSLGSVYPLACKNSERGTERKGEEMAKKTRTLLDGQFEEKVRKYKGVEEIFFLGKHKKHNKNIYEHLFLKNRG